MTTSERYLLKEARLAIARSKFACARVYLRGLPDVPQVRETRQWLKEAQGDAESYQEASREERDAHDNL